MTARVWATVETSSTPVTSTRGTITWRAAVSARSNTSWIMRFSSSERSSCSETMYLISSSEICPSSASLIWKSLAMPLAEAEVSHTSGLAIVEKTTRERETALEMRSGLAIAMRLGTSSPITMLKYETASVMRMGEMPGAMAVSQPMPNDDIHWAKGSDRLVEATAEEKKPTSVMATWIVARNLLGSLARSAATCALRSPSSASLSSRGLRALTRAISDIEK